MRKHMFFHRVWQFNALAIAALSALGILVGSFAAFHIARDLLRDRHVGGLARTAPDSATPDTEGGDAQVQDARVSVGRFVRLSGTKFMWAPLELEQTYDLAIASKHATSTANHVFYDTANGQSHTVLQGNQQIITDFEAIRVPNVSVTEPPVLLLYEIIEKDTNGDGYLNRQDAKRMALAKPDGRQLTRLPPVVDVMLGNTLGADGLFIVFARTGTSETAYRINSDTFAIISSNPITRSGN